MTFVQKWPDTYVLCPQCGQPDNTGDCDHTPLTYEQVLDLGGEFAEQKFICPQCLDEAEFEIRGSRRVYILLDDDLEEDTWTESDPSDLDIDSFEDGEEIIYCNNCDSELRREELLRRESHAQGSERTKA